MKKGGIIPQKMSSHAGNSASFKGFAKSKKNMKKQKMTEKCRK